MYGTNTIWRFSNILNRGLTEDEAASMIVRGFLDIDIKGLPEDLAQETKKLIDLSMEGM